MWLRPSPQNPLPTLACFNLAIDLDEAETIGTNLDPHILNDPGLRVLLSIAEPHLGPITHTQHQTHGSWWLRAGDCWADTNDGQPGFDDEESNR